MRTAFLCTFVLCLSSVAHAVSGVGLDADGTLLLLPDQVVECAGDGKIQRTYTNGKKQLVGQCKGGLYVGTWKAFHETGKKMWEVTFQDGKPVGAFESYWPDGKDRVRAVYLDGSLQGPFKAWHQTGKISATGDYRAGKRAGCWETYYDNGEHESKGAYNAGTKVSTWLLWDKQKNKRRDKLGGETAQGACLLML